MKNPDISIIIPTFNRQHLLSQTLDSVRAQTFANWEAWVVDDGSTDGTEEYVAHLEAQDSRIHYVKRDRSHRGAPACRNQGVELARGHYVIFLDSDDCLAPNNLENRFQQMERHPDLDFGVFGCILFRDRPGDTALLWNKQTPEDDLDRFLANDLPWQTTSPIWRKEALEKLGLWDETLITGQDWDQHLRALILQLRYQYFSPPDCYWRMPHADTIGSRSKAGDYLACREKLLELAQERLASAQLLTPKRQELLGKCYFWLADTWIDDGDKMAAFEVWERCYERQLLDRSLHGRGLRYLQIIATIPSSWRRVARKAIREWGDRAIVFHWPETFRNTPLDAPVS